MNASQKFAWFTLSVIALVVLTVLVLFPIIGRGALGGCGFLGLLGLSPFCFRRHGDEVVQDERDTVIWQRSLVIAYSAFWVIFVLASMMAAFVYGWEGNVPVPMVLAGVWIGFILVQGAMSLAILLQYRAGASNAA
jgi:hypothetical protein